MQPGSIVAGRYQIVARIGGGGMGEVFRAIHGMSRREVALKIIPAARGHSAEAAARFQREASAPAAIGHPAIADVYDAGVDPESGAFFIAMELLVGTSLRERMGPNAVPWILAVLEPLATAHAKGFVHRDLKPENVFIDQSTGVERVKLLDFGLARRLDDLGVTGTGTSMGSPYYMAPEQWMSARSAGPTADVFAIGVMLYEAIAGHRPFEAATPAALLVQMQNTRPASLSGIAPLALSALVDRCLALDPAQRPRDAGELYGELTRALSHSHAPDAFAATLAPTPALYVATRVPMTFAPAEVERRTPARRGCVIAAIAAAVLAIAAVSSGAVLYFVLGEREAVPRDEPPVVAPAIPAAPASDLVEVDGAGFRIAMPRAWQNVPPTLYYAHVQYREPSPGSVPRQITVESYPWADSIDSMAAHCLAIPREGGGEVDYDRAAVMSGQPGREVRWAAPHAQGAYRQVQRMTLHEGRAWILACVGPAETFETQEALCARVLDTFTFQ